MPAAPKISSPTDGPKERRTLFVRLGGLFARLVAPVRRQLLPAVVLVCGLSVIGGSAASIAYYYLGTGAARDARRAIRQALAAADAGRYEDAKHVLGHRWRLAALTPAEVGQPLFILGLVLAHEAAQARSPAERETLYLLAARYLEEARDRGFPAGRQQRGWFELARCLFRSGRYAESLPALIAAMEACPGERYQLCRWLATAYLRDPVPQLQRALHYSHLALDTPHLTDHQRDEAAVELALIQLLLGDIAGCRAALATVPPTASVRDQAMILEARCLIHDADQTLVPPEPVTTEASVSTTAAEKYQQAMRLLEEVPGADLAGITTRQSQYLFGICQRQLGDVRGALQTFARVRRLHTGTAEAFAAALDEADLQDRQGSPTVARDLYVSVIRDAADPAHYYNPWVPLTELRQRLAAALRRFRGADQYQAALALRETLGRIFPVDELTAIEAETLAAWGEHLMQPLAAGGVLQQAVQFAEARARFRAAADAYRRLAALRYTTQHYPQDLWKSGDCFLRGQNYAAALPVLRQYLDHAPRTQQAQGLVALGECHLTLGNYHQALDLLRQCIESFPKHPETYRARLLASQTCVQLQQVDEAKQFLVDNLHNSDLTPQSLQWQHSLFAYGLLLFAQARADEAASRPRGTTTEASARSPESQAFLSAAYDRFQEARQLLEEAIRRYPGADAANRARYCIAESCRLAARWPASLLLVEAAPTRRRQLQEQQRTQLAQAAAGYQQLQSQLLEEQPAELPVLEQALLRNTVFTSAEVWCDLEDYELALQAYGTASQRYQHEPESLEALAQMAHGYRRAGSPEKARETIGQAQAVLARMREDADYEKTTRYPREAWSQFLGWLAGQ